MEIYLVGGAVRNLLLNLPSHDRDFVVVGSTSSAMKNMGFIQVAKSFPVFLHPITKEEYALARVETKVGLGYHGFAYNLDPTISLEEDLARRDITINAIAIDIKGNIHDPYGGLHDLKLKVIRHVSPAFSDDPLRVLRVARFYAKLFNLGFYIHQDTLELMRSIVSKGELASISSERILLETNKALNTPTPHLFFQILKDIGAYEYILTPLNDFPETHWSYITGIRQYAKQPESLLALVALSLHKDKLSSFVESLKCSNRVKKIIHYVVEYFARMPRWHNSTVDDVFHMVEDLSLLKQDYALWHDTLAAAYKHFDLSISKLISFRVLFEYIKTFPYGEYIDHKAPQQSRIALQKRCIKAFLSKKNQL